AGMSYHIGMDATLDGFTPYKDLPFSMSMMDHRALMGLNAVAEWVGRRKARTGDDALVHSHEG
ncbi:MAG: hypothetical protein HOK28_03830, partial [Deltaproteobacteria bacterium]|nr:hypothetical protein [Deltaproteobacteria bacterium]